MTGAPSVASVGTVPAGVPEPDAVVVYHCLVCGPVMRFTWTTCDDTVTFHRSIPHPFCLDADDWEHNPQ
jgi:hypothetical protein